MSQNDYVIANQTTPLFRTDLNLALQALASNSSGSTAPITTYANMLWYDTTTKILKMRNEADSAWINLGTLDQGAGNFSPAGIATQTQTVWNTGTSITESLISSAKLDAKINDEVSTVFVGGRVAALAAGAVGTYLWATTTTNLTFGDTIAGASLTPAGTRNSTDIDQVEDTTVTLSGTWRLMGGNKDGTVGLMTLWLRIV